VEKCKGDGFNVGKGWDQVEDSLHCSGVGPLETVEGCGLVLDISAKNELGIVKDCKHMVVDGMLKQTEAQVVCTLCPRTMNLSEVWVSDNHFIDRHCGEFRESWNVVQSVTEILLNVGEVSITSTVSRYWHR
jgi:hypothetical protein